MHAPDSPVIFRQEGGKRNRLIYSNVLRDLVSCLDERCNFPGTPEEIWHELKTTGRVCFSESIDRSCTRRPLAAAESSPPMRPCVNGNNDTVNSN